MTTCFAMFYATPSNAIVLPVPVTGQDTTSWCAYAALQAVETYYGNGRAQYLDVIWAEQANINAGIWVGTFVDCHQYATYPYPAIPNPFFPAPNCYPLGTDLGSNGVSNIQDIMTIHYGTGTSYLATPISTATDVQTEIYAGRPFIMGVGRAPSGESHAIVGHEISGTPGDGQMPGSPTWSNTYVHVMDP